MFSVFVMFCVNSVEPQRERSVFTEQIVLHLLRKCCDTIRYQIQIFIKYLYKSRYGENINFEFKCSKQSWL